jgi:sec-independent protein translocase protein TatC
MPRLRAFWTRIFNRITAPFRPVFRLIQWLARGLYSVRRDVNRFFNEEIDDSTLGDAVSKAVEAPSGLKEHLLALRRHLFRSVVALIFTSIIVGVYFDQIMDLLTHFLEDGTRSLSIIEVTEGLSVFMRVTLLGGFIVAFPYIALELWLFIGWGLHRSARRWGCVALPFATLLFLSGVAFAYFVLLPTAIPFLLNFGDFQQNPHVSNYVSVVTSLLFWMGVAFEFPLIMFALAALGIVDAQVLRQQWRLAVVVIAFISAMITPTVDPWSMGLVMLPLIGLYGFGILLAKFAGLLRGRSS